MEILYGVIATLIGQAIWWLFGNRIKKFPSKFLSDKANRVRQKIGGATCKILGHKFVPQEIHYPAISGFHLYSECESCGKRKDEETIPYEEMVRRNKNKSP